MCWSAIATAPTLPVGVPAVNGAAASTCCLLCLLKYTRPRVRGMCGLSKGAPLLPSLSHDLGNRVAGTTLPTIREKGREGELARQPGLQSITWMSRWSHCAVHTGRAQDCPCIARSAELLCCSPLYKRCLDLRVGALASNNNGKLKDGFGGIRVQVEIAALMESSFNILGSSLVIV